MSDNSNTENSGERKYHFFQIRPYKFSELAKLYNVDTRTFKKWLAKIWHRLGEILGQFLSIEQVEIVVSHLKVPYQIKTETTEEDEAKGLIAAKTKSLQAEEQKNVSKQIPDNRNQRKANKKAKSNRIKNHKARLTKKRNRK